jgi:hypothetical protein
MDGALRSLQIAMRTLNARIIAIQGAIDASSMLSSTSSTWSALERARRLLSSTHFFNNDDDDNDNDDKDDDTMMPNRLVYNSKLCHTNGFTTYRLLAGWSTLPICLLTESAA